MRLREEPLPKLRDAGLVDFALRDELLLVFLRGLDLLLQILRELFLERWVRELLQQHWRKIDVRLQSGACLFQIREHAQHREIGLRSGFMQPIEPVRPRAVMHHVRQMGMQRKGDVRGRIGGLTLHGGFVQGTRFSSLLQG